MIQQVDVAAIRSLLAAATPGPIEAHGSQLITRDPATIASELASHLERWPGDGVVDERTVFAIWYDGGALVGESMRKADAELFAALAQAAPALLDEIERLRQASSAERAACAALLRELAGGVVRDVYYHHGTERAPFEVGDALAALVLEGRR